MALRFLPFTFPGVPNVGCLFQMRTPREEDPSEGTIAFRDGMDPALVAKNRAQLLKAAGVRTMAEMHQVHGETLVFEPEGSDLSKDSTLDADGIATGELGKGLMVKTADCQPVFVAHISGKYIMALHVGWRGDRILFPLTAVRSFCRQYELRPEHLVAVRGPSLGPTKAKFTRFAAEWGGYFAKYLDLGTSTMDLWTMTEDQLVQAGIPRRQIFGIDICTATNVDDFFSYRADRNCGRQASIIWRCY